MDIRIRSNLVHLNAEKEQSRISSNIGSGEDT